MRTLNLNDSILVKLHDEAYQILADRHNKYVGIITNYNKVDADYYKNQSDDNGYTKFQLWGFIETFSEYIKLGTKPPFELTLIIYDEPKKSS